MQKVNSDFTQRSGKIILQFHLEKWKFHLEIWKLHLEKWKKDFVKIWLIYAIYPLFLILVNLIIKLIIKLYYNNTIIYGFLLKQKDGILLQEKFRLEQKILLMLSEEIMLFWKTKVDVLEIDPYFVKLKHVHGGESL